MNYEDTTKLRLELARLIRRQEISIGDLYNALGVDLDSYRVDAGDAIAEIAGILKGWNNPPDQ